MIGIIDYGMGNLGSVSNACKFLALPSQIITSPEQMDACEALILPGVGAFGDCMTHLTDHGFVEPVKTWVVRGRPLLGICLGLQVLYAESEESPGVAGLGLLPGRVERFRLSSEYKIPQIGWNRLWQKAVTCPLFDGVPDGAHFYFDHSFYVDTPDQDTVAGTTDYGAHYPSAVWKDNLLAIQFHPEKSQKDGLRMLSNFGRWVTHDAAVL